MRFPSSLRLARGLAILCLAVLGTWAQAQPAADETDDALTSIRRQLDTAQLSLRNSENLSDAELASLRGSALAANARANDIANRLTPDLAGLEARVTQLGTPPPGAKEDPDIAAQRSQLTKSRNAAGDEVKLARLLAVESQQLADQLAALRRSEFQARLGERTDSILSAPFWTSLFADWQADADRLATVGRTLGASAARAPLAVWIGAPLAAALACWLLWFAMHRLMRWLQTRAPAGRLRRSLHALVSVLEWTGSFGFFGVALHSVLDWPRALPAPSSTLVANLVAMIWFAGFVYGLLRALICAGRPSWRLLRIPDPVAASLRALPWQVTLTSFAAWATERLTTLVDSSLSLTVAANGLVALAMGATVGLMLIRAERIWRRDLAEREHASRPLWLAIAGVASWILLGIAVISLLAGYVAFGSFVVKQVVWSGIVLGATYLTAALVDDLLMAWLANAPAADGATEAPRAAPRIPAQVAVLTSGLLRFALVLVALMLLLAPFGEGPAELLRRGGQWQQGLAIGEFRLRPGAVLQALVVLLVGLGVVRLLRSWLDDRYLPTTSLDAGMRSSVTSLFGVVGGVVAIAMALSAMGIGLERIAWVASALSVGIGFGLQAVVQNFVSGLILLAERPVKVGDWVSLGGVEGDIRRINVRATEIQQGDRSTVIVPNSEFITKTVRNVTHANPLGLVQLKLPLPLSSDAEQVRALLLEIFLAHQDLVESPAPTVALDGIEGGLLVFNATGFVDSPRKAYNVRSALLFEVLKRFAAAGIALAKPATMLLGGLPTVAEPAVEPKP